MLFDVASDLHLDFFDDNGRDFLAGWVPQAPRLILAGDLGEFRWWRENLLVLRSFCELYEDVLFCAGNHDYYGTSLKEGDARFRQIQEEVPNFHFLEREIWEVEDCRIAGCSLWFKEDPMSPFYEGWMSDFRLIQGLKPAVYERNQESQDFLRNLPPVDIVMTHHMPTHMSVHERYINDPCNRFFLCNLDEVILEKEPKVWVHGHTHVPCDYYLGNTRVVCHPKGYPRENPGAYNPVTIEV